MQEQRPRNLRTLVSRWGQGISGDPVVFQGGWSQIVRDAVAPVVSCQHYVGLRCDDHFESRVLLGLHRKTLDAFLAVDLSEQRHALLVVTGHGDCLLVRPQRQEHGQPGSGVHVYPLRRCGERLSFAAVGHGHLILTRIGRLRLLVRVDCATCKPNSPRRCSRGQSCGATAPMRGTRIHGVPFLPRRCRAGRDRRHMPLGTRAVMSAGGRTRPRRLDQQRCPGGFPGQLRHFCCPGAR